MSTRTPLARRFIAALLLVLLTACHSWQPTTVSPQQLIAEEQPSSVRVTLMNDETITLEYPTMRNDSIIGVVPYLTGYSRTVAVSDVSRFEVRQPNAGRTRVLLLLTGLAAIGIAIGIYAANFSCCGFVASGDLP